MTEWSKRQQKKWRKKNGNNLNKWVCAVFVCAESYTLSIRILLMLKLHSSIVIWIFIFVQMIHFVRVWLAIERNGNSKHICLGCMLNSGCEFFFHI